MCDKCECTQTGGKEWGSFQCEWLCIDYDN